MTGARFQPATSMLGFTVSQMDVRRNAAIAQHVQRLEEARHAGGSLEMPDVAFDRADGQRLFGGTMPAEGLADGARFERIADRGSGAVRLKIIDLARARSRRGHRPHEATRPAPRGSAQ